MSANRFAMGIVALALVATANDLSKSRAEGLRIETEVYIGDEDEPQSRTVTLFDAGTVYDFVSQPPQIAVFRPPSSSRPGQFILLDLKSKRRTEVSTKRISNLIKKLTSWASEQEDPLLKFSSKPDFEESFDDETGTLDLSSEQWQYKVATIPAEDTEALARYREFADWYTRLNTMMYSSPPPGPRLRLNALMQLHGVVPVEIRRTVASDSTSVRATHLFTWRLSREDRARLDEARRHLASFKKVNNEDFLASKASSDVVRGQSR